MVNTSGGKNGDKVPNAWVILSTWGQLLINRVNNVARGSEDRVHGYSGTETAGCIILL